MLADSLEEDCAGRQCGVVKSGGPHWSLTWVTSGKSLNFSEFQVLKHYVELIIPPFQASFKGDNDSEDGDRGWALLQLYPQVPLSQPGGQTGTASG